MSENYLGIIQEKEVKNKFIENIITHPHFYNGCKTIISFVWNKIKCYPCKVHFECDDCLPYDQAMCALKEFGLIESTMIQKYGYSTKNQLFQKMLVMELEDNIFVALTYGDIEEKFGPKRVQTFDDVDIHYLPESENTVECILKKLREAILKPIQKKSIKMIIEYYDYDENDQPIKVIDFETVDIKDPKITDLKLHYGERFLKTHDTIMNALKQETPSKGNLILLHGLPGTGKTHYIRYLIHNLERQFIYMSTDMVQKMSDPELISFLLNQQNSIIIVEDAENIIKNRCDSDSKTQATANLLNLTDGLLGDSLQHTVIATFNCELSSIDPALLRKGRMVAIHEFDKLSQDEAQKLSDHLGFTSFIAQPMTLADIYTQEK